MSQLFTDIRFGVRLLLKAPITSAAAILSLALGIGGTTTIFSAVDAILLRPLPYHEPERLVLVSATSPMFDRASSTRRGGSLAPADFFEYRNNSVLDGLASVSTSARSRPASSTRPSSTPSGHSLRASRSPS